MPSSGLVIFLAYFLTKKEEKIRSFSFGFLPTLLISGLVIALVLKEPDFGAAFFLTVMVFLLLFVSGARVIYIAGSFLLAAPGGLLFPDQRGLSLQEADEFHPALG